MDALPLYALVGAIAGLLAGMLGIGGGLITVPAVYYILERNGISSGVSMHLAVGTSTAALVLTTMVSAYSHHRHGGVLWSLWQKLTPGLMVGAVIGALITGMLPGDLLRMIFGVCEILLAAYIGLYRPHPLPRALPGIGALTATAFVIGNVCSILGLGGGLLVVPYLLWCGISMRESVATAAATGVPIAFAGAITYMFAAVDENTLPPLSWGQVYIPALIGIGVASVICAPLGAMLSHRLPATTLRHLFAGVIALFGLIVLVKPG